MHLKAIPEAIEIEGMVVSFVCLGWAPLSLASRVCMLYIAAAGNAVKDRIVSAPSRGDTAWGPMSVSTDEVISS